MRAILNTNNIMCFYTSISIVDVHYHSCYQIVVSTDTTFDSNIEGTEYKNIKGFIINKNVKHSCHAPKGNFLIYYVESKSFFGKQIKKVLHDKTMIDIESLLPSKQLESIGKDFNRSLSGIEIKKISDTLLFDMFKKHFLILEKENMDQRILKAIGYIDENFETSISLNQVADYIHLSPERTRHLFLEQMETSFSQYVLWKRIKAVLKEVIQKKKSFFDASLQYGFTDQSHFNRYFKRMFGISANVILKNSQFIQFVYPEV